MRSPESGIGQRVMMWRTGVIVAVCAAFGLMAAPSDAASREAISPIYAFGATAGDGSHPIAGLTYARGHLYGATRDGGSFGRGAIVELTPSPTTFGGGARERVIYSFGAAATDGAEPTGTLLASEDGTLFGTTQSGGSGLGTVFRLDPPGPGETDWTETVLHPFIGGSDGSAPAGGVVADRDGNLYGATARGGDPVCGPPGCGTIFRLSPPRRQTGGGWATMLLHAFTGSDGMTPAPGLLVRDGGVYGATTFGGPAGRGTIFRLAPGRHAQLGWTVTTLHAFNGRADGANPVSGPVFDAGGTLYGTTRNGGDAPCPRDPRDGCGVAFALAPAGSPGGTWTQTALYGFTGDDDGLHPGARLTFGKFGSLFGTTEGDERGNGGSVFALTPPARINEPWALATLHVFSGGRDGASPRGPMIRVGAGFYGTTPLGGEASAGTAFSLRP